MSSVTSDKCVWQVDKGMDRTTLTNHLHKFHIRQKNQQNLAGDEWSCL